MSNSDIYRVELNGALARVEDLKPLWLSNYGHYTVLPVENGRVRGLALHLERLDQNTRMLFDCGIDADRVRSFVRKALDGYAGPVSVRVNVFSRHGTIGRVIEPDILVTVSEPLSADLSPLRVRSATYERDLPQAKHAGTFGLIYQRRLAQLEGYDDVLFIDQFGHVSEGSTWNVGFFDGERIIWPDAPALPGISMRLVQAGLRERHIPFETREVRLRDLSTFRSAFLTSLHVGPRPIASIDDLSYTIDDELNATLQACYQETPAEEV